MKKELQFRAKYDGAKGGYIYSHKEVLFVDANNREEGWCRLSLVNGQWGVQHEGSNNDWGPLKDVEIIRPQQLK